MYDLEDDDDFDPVGEDMIANMLKDSGGPPLSKGDSATAATGSTTRGDVMKKRYG
jgi:hypothetical protein